MPDARLPNSTSQLDEPRGAPGATNFDQIDGPDRPLITTGSNRMRSDEGHCMTRSLQKVDRAGARELRERLRASGTAKHLGFEVARVTRGRVVLRMRVKQHHKQVHGVVHGGVLAALADTAGGLAAWTTASGPRIATIEMKI